MAGVNLHEFLRDLTRGMAAATLEEDSDRALAERFLARRDEAAFEALTRRHGPMVYRVCWRVLQQSQDVEDAFQATFLALAQKLGTVRKRNSLASWLHGVAHRVALKVRRAQVAERVHRLDLPGYQARPSDETTWKELRAVLDGELGCLPEKWRLPLILCYLEGETQDEAAGQLGWGKNTLRRRLEEARAVLGRRLRRRGIVWPATFAAAMLSDCAVSAALPGPLLIAAVNAANCVAAKQVVTGVVSPKAIALAEGVLKTMWLSKMKFVAVVGLLLTVTSVGVNGVFQSWGAQLGTEPRRDQAAKAAPGGPRQTSTHESRVTDLPNQAAKNHADEPRKKELERLQGTWRGITAETDGSKKDATGLIVLIRGETITFNLEKRKRTSTFKLDLAATPKAMLMQGPAPLQKDTRAIYLLKGDDLTICFNNLDGAAPTEFATRRGDRLWLVVLKRENFEDFAEFGFGGGGVSGTGIRDKGGFTVVPIPQPGKARGITRLCVSIAVREEDVQAEFRVVGVDQAGKRHEPIGNAGASAGGKGVGVITRVVEFNLPSDQIETLVIQKRREKQ